MSIGYRVQGIKLPDAKWRSMKAIWDSCEEAGVEVPREVEKFFNGETPDPAGVVMDLEDHPCAKRHEAEMEDGFVVDLALVPKGVRMIRFVTTF